MKVQIQSRKLVTPSIPTPPNLRNYKISYPDELAPTINVPFVFYYTGNDTTSDKTADSLQIFRQIEKSLAQALTQFYPLAGRYINGLRVVDCNDQGVEYVEALVNGRLRELISQEVKPELLSDFLPCEIGAADEITDPLIAIQVNMFECGGLAICLCISHRIGDASTLTMFVNAWTSASRGESVEAISPSFNLPIFFPGRNLPGLALGIPRTSSNMGGHRSVTRKFSFNKQAISTLRAICSLNDKGKRRPASLQLVNAVLLRTLVRIDRAKHGYSRTSFLIQPVNLRGKTDPPLSNHSFGNLWGLATTECMAGETDNMGFQDFENLLSESIRNAVQDCKKILSRGEEGHRVLINSYMKSNENLSNPDQVNFCLFTSWCKFPYYEADFGWGKPIWASTWSLPLQNVVILMDGKEGDGIDAWVHLDEKDMPSFQQDYEIKAFTT